MFLGFIALALLPLPDATAIGYAAPLIVVVLASIFLKEQIRLYRWSAVMLGFLGVLLTLRDHFGLALPSPAFMPAEALGALIALLGAGCTAIATIQTRRLTLSEHTGAIVFYFSLLTTLAGLAVCLAGLFWRTDWIGAGFIMAQPAWLTPSGWDFAFLALIGVFGGIAQILMTESFRHAEASVTACFDYTSLLWAMLLGLFVFGETPSIWVLAGSLIIAAAGIFVALRERKRAVQR
jgi:drug/metabolite transporter (DMT)-like permease